MKNKSFYILVAISILMVLSFSCSTKKNNWKTRQYHALTTRYNVYYNGHVAYNRGMKGLKNSHNENYTQPLSIYEISDLGERAGGSGQFENAIKKCKIAIKTHSIQAKPKKKRGKVKDLKYRKFMSQKEYNPFIWHTWMMWADAKLHQGKYMAAASTFSYVIKMYPTNQDILNKARIGLFRSYCELRWYYDAEQILQILEKEELTGKDKHNYQIAYCDYLLKQKQYEKALPILQQAIKKEHGKTKTRFQFLLAQLYQLQKDKKKAYKLYGKIARKSPPYDMELNARIKQTEVMSDKNQKKIIKKLTRMSKRQKNKDYLDQVFYALGNTYLNKKDTTKAIVQYLTGASRSKLNGISKAMCLISAGDLYYDQQKYMHAQPCYSEAFGLLKDKESQLYKRLEKLCPVLDEMSVYARNIEEQDSIQGLAKMPKEEQLKVIQKVIDQVIKERKEKETEELRKLAGNKTQTKTTTRKNTTPKKTINRDRSWYFYNKSLLIEGKQEFQKKWGNRRLSDFWRLKNKPQGTFEDQQQTEETSDTIQNKESNKKQFEEKKIIELDEKALNDSLKQDPERPEFYLSQLPSTPEDFEISDNMIKEGLYNVGLILKNSLEDYPAAITNLEALLSRYPKNDYLADVYFNLFQIYYRLKNKQQADYYRQKLIEKFPKNENSILLAKPNFEKEYHLAKQIQDSIYETTYYFYLENKNNLVKTNYLYIKNTYPKAPLMPKYMFLYALTQLKEKDLTGFKETIDSIHNKYPNSDLKQLILAIEKGVAEGRKIDANAAISSDIWEQYLDTDQTTKKEKESTIHFSKETNGPFLLLFAYPKGTINGNILLYKVADYNFSNFLIKNFDLDFGNFNNIELLKVTGFAKYDDVIWYRKMFYQRKILSDEMNKTIRTIIISQNNYDLLLKHFTFKEYFDFYNTTFNNPQTEEQE